MTKADTNAHDDESDCLHEKRNDSDRRKGGFPIHGVPVEHFEQRIERRIGFDNKPLRSRGLEEFRGATTRKAPLSESKSPIRKVAYVGKHMLRDASSFPLA